jgi:signal transduction histidine kinase
MPANCSTALSSGFEAVGAGRRLSVDAQPNMRVTADRLRLEQALGNVLDNALRHGAGDVHLSAGSRDGRAEIHVRDDGPGFPRPFIADAFERFTRADEARARGGSGLGLAIARAIARAHGGEAFAANREDGGADVWIELPDGSRKPAST